MKEKVKALHQKDFEDFEDRFLLNSGKRKEAKGLIPFADNGFTFLNSKFVMPFSAFKSRLSSFFFFELLEVGLLES